MATKNAALMLARIPAWPRFTPVAPRKSTNERAARASRGVLGTARANPEAFVVTPCGQHIARVGPNARFAVESATEMSTEVSLVDAALAPAFAAAAAAASSSSYTTTSPASAVGGEPQEVTIGNEMRLCHGRHVLEPGNLRRFAHVLTTSPTRQTGTRRLRIVIDLDEDLGVNVGALRATPAGCRLERVVFAHLFPATTTTTTSSDITEGGEATPSGDPAGSKAANARDRASVLLTAAGWNRRGLRTVDEAAAAATVEVLVPVVSAITIRKGHCTVDELARESRWNALSHVLPSMSQCVWDSSVLRIVGPCVVARDPRTRLQLSRQRRRRVAEQQMTTSGADGAAAEEPTQAELYGLDGIPDPRLRAQVAATVVPKFPH